MVGCSTIAIQRIENGSLPLSHKMAYTIMEATGADPVHLRAGAKAMDMMGREYTKDSYEFLRNVLPCTDDECRLLLGKIVSYAELLLVASQRGTQYKTRAVFAETVEALENIAEAFNLKRSIHSFLIEKGSVDKRNYRVSDLRKFPEFARIIGFKDDKRFSPDKLVPHVRPRGWIPDYFLDEEPVLPPDAEMKIRPNAVYIIDAERPIPNALRDIIDQALYWRIKEFRLDLTYAK